MNNASPELGDRGAHHLVADQVRARPDHPAVVDEHGRAVSYRQLWASSGGLATELAARGVGRGSTVAIALERSPELAVALVAVARTGASYVALDPHAPADRVAFVLAETAAPLVVRAPDGVAWPLPADLPTLTVSGEDQPHQDGADSGPLAAVALDDPLCVCYTSGSTGRPKGALLTHRGIVGFISEPTYLALRPDDRVANVSTPSFDLNIFEVWNTLAAGATLVVLPPLADTPLDKWAGLFADTGITTMILTTALLDAVVHEDPATFRSLRHLLFGGETVDPETVRRMLAAEPAQRLVHMYGPTEATTFTTFHVCTAENTAGVERLPIGRAIQQTTLHVVGEDLHPVPAGQVGELCIGGPRIALGYLARPELTAEKFVVLPTGERAYRSGDLVRELPDGLLEFHGRVDRQVKLRGFRIELEEIERVGARTGLVDSVVVEKVGDGAHAQLVGFAVPAPTAGPDLPDRLSDAVRAALPDYMVPARWQVLAELPLTQRGKVDRAALVAGLTAAPQAGPARDGVAEQVRAVLAELLAVPDLALDANFLELGGNSIMALQAAARLRDRLGVEINPADVLFADTLGALADQVTAEVPA